VPTDILTYITPNPLAGIVYLDAFPTISSIQVVGTPFSLEILPLLLDNSNVTSSKDSSIAFVRACFSRPDNVPYSVLTSLIGMNAYQTPNVSVALLSRAQNTTALEAAAKNGLKALLVQGTDDQLVDPQNVYQTIKAIFANLEVAWIAGGSHAAFYEERDQVVGAILGFLDSVKVGTLVSDKFVATIA
jgi:pimeloyl-ACP methyl ester carboxylesterase